MYLLYSRRQDYPLVAFKDATAAERQAKQMNEASHGMYYVRDIQVR